MEPSLSDAKLLRCWSSAIGQDCHVTLRTEKAHFTLPTQFLQEIKGRFNLKKRQPNTTEEM